MINRPAGLGVGYAWQDYIGLEARLDRDLRAAGASWLRDWLASAERVRAYRHYYPTLWDCSRKTDAQRQNWRKAVAVAQIDPGRVFFLGTEPNRKDQSWTTVWQFASAARQFKRATPDTPLALPGVLLTTPGALPEDEDGWRWLAGYALLIQQGKAPPPDFWCVDIFAHVAQQFLDILRPFRQWTKDAGIVRPIIIGEMAGAMGGYPTMQSDDANRAIMAAAREAISRGEIVAAMWDSARSANWPGPASNLLTDGGALTALGKAYAGRM